MRRKFSIGILLLLCAVVVTGEQQRTDILDMRAGALILAHPGQHNKEWPAMGMLDGTTRTGWASTKRKPFPHHVTIELSQTYLIDTLAVDNTNADEFDFPLISAKEVVFFGSDKAVDGDYQLLGTVMASKAGRAVLKLADPRPVRWMRVEIRSNFGNARFTELMELEAYGTPLEPEPVRPNFSGHYITNWEMLQLKRQGTQLTGCYDLDSGYLQGTTDGRVLKFRWVEHGGSEVGEAVLVVSSNGNFLNGLWYEGGEQAGVWFGNRDLSGNAAQCSIEKSAAELAHFLNPK